VLQVVSKPSDSSSIASMAEGTRIHQLSEDISGMTGKVTDLDKKIVPPVHQSSNAL
jgi:hypothetical protein